MIKYVPFLKLKQNEIQSVGVLDGGIRDQIAPMYDIPRTQKVMDEDEVIDRLRIADKELGNALENGINYKFFVDNFDVDDSVDLGMSRSTGPFLQRCRITKLCQFWPLIGTQIITSRRLISSNRDRAQMSVYAFK